MSSVEWTDAQVCFFINERKERNFEFHSTSNKKKCLFWDDVARKINVNSNCFTGEDCRKKFTNLTKAYKVSCSCLGFTKNLTGNILMTTVKYWAGGKKRSLVGEEIYQEFST